MVLVSMLELGSIFQFSTAEAGVIASSLRVSSWMCGGLWPPGVWWHERTSIVRWTWAGIMCRILLRSQIPANRTRGRNLGSTKVIVVSQPLIFILLEVLRVLVHFLRSCPQWRRCVSRYGEVRA